MLIIGLTGSIGMGKTTAAQRFASHGVPVSEADAIVHALYVEGGAAVAPVSRLVPDAVIDGTIDRPALSRALAADPSLFPRLEAIVHPLVREAQARFLADAKALCARMALLDIPLLFETNGDARVDVVVVVHAPLGMQRDRVLARPGMTRDKFEAINAKQMQSEEKCRHADFVIDTSGSLAESAAQVDRLVAALSDRKGTVFDRLWS